MLLSLRRLVPRCLPVLFSAAAVASGCAGHRAPYKNYNLVLITIETTRSDFLGCYGSDADCTPHLDSLAAHGTLVQECYTVAPWTRPSIASIWTGLAPSRHGATTEDTRSWLPEGAWTLAEAFRQAGYRTFGCVTNANLAPELAFDQGFEEYFYLPSARGQRLNEEALRWAARVKAEDGSVPLFIALHYDEPHGSFLDAGFDRRIGDRGRAEMVAACEAFDDIQRLWGIEVYRARLAQVDSAVGALVEATREFLGDSCVFVITADHGEEWFDHGGLFHGFTLYHELLSVPLIFYVPGQPPAIVSGPVRTYDLYPTLCDWLGVRRPGSVDGRSLSRALLEGGRFPNEVFAQTSYRAPLASVQSGNHKLIWDIRSGAVELFDRAADPREQTDLADARPRVVRALLRRLERVPTKAAETTRRALPPDSGEAEIAGDRSRLEEDLRSIGYVAAKEPSAERPRRGARIAWQDIRRAYQFVSPRDPILQYESGSMHPTGAPPRVVIGSRRGDRCWGTCSFQRAFVVLDSHQWSGDAEVLVDGALWTRVSLYSPTETSSPRIIPISFEERGEHRVEIVVTGEKRPESLSSRVFFDGIAIEREAVHRLAGR